ncbi:phytolongin Phyl2.1-like [Quillaja saponaria]|uniref:Phytolongin Phyl2.1-like n=1 Tax=Quillaja saponaria TaxID=32244 RepID=A0AAD7LVX9_QUISA|nr:phytolongin Phyl2.1-like [Quillaja saponaria]
MILNPSLIFYACIAKGTTILAEYTSREPNIEGLAQQCLEKTPKNHSVFSHTVKQRTYLFLMGDPFVYFLIFDEKMEKLDGLWFLDRIKYAIEEMMESRSMKGSDHFSSLCFQAQFDVIFRETMVLDLNLENTSASETNDSRNPSLDSVKGIKVATAPLLGNKSKGLQKKKKRVGMEANGVDGRDVVMEKKLDMSHDVNGISRDFSLSVPKSLAIERQKAKHIWKKHVWVVLLLDLFVCSVLFGIWLWVCRGFKCIDH